MSYVIIIFQQTTSHVVPLLWLQRKWSSGLDCQGRNVKHNPTFTVQDYKCWGWSRSIQLPAYVVDNN